MTSTRRLGTETSTTRTALMDAVEAVMREEGYGALTARSVAERAGLKHQLVYYYFQTIRDLLVATYERHIDRYLARIEAALSSPRPLHAFWAVHANAPDATLNMEFLALANHHQAIRERTVAFGEEVRRLGLKQMDTALRRPRGDADALTPFAVTMILSSVGSVLGLESAIGITGGHGETRRLIEWCIDRLEPEGPAT